MQSCGSDTRDLDLRFYGANRRLLDLRFYGAIGACVMRRRDTVPETGVLSFLGDGLRVSVGKTARADRSFLTPCLAEAKDTAIPASPTLHRPLYSLHSKL